MAAGSLQIAGQPALAQAISVAPAAADAASWAVQWENDLFARGRTDRHYTNGIRILRLRAARQLAGPIAPSPGDGWISAYAYQTGNWLCQLAACQTDQAAVAVDSYLAQNMYTPENLRRVVPNTADRPYAGWLQLGQRTRLLDLPDAHNDATRLQTLDLSIGVVGPSAGAGAVQRQWHRIVGAVAPQGWGYQLRDRPALQVVYTRTHRLRLGALADMLPHWRLSAGNVFVAAAAGGQLRIGPGLAGFGHVEPMQSLLAATQSAAEPSEGRGGSPLFGFAGFEARAVAHNLFIDGRSGRDGLGKSEISRKPLVVDLNLGLSARIGHGWRLSYAHVWRSREFTPDVPLQAVDRRAALQRYGVVQLQRDL